MQTIGRLYSLHCLSGLGITRHHILFIIEKKKKSQTIQLLGSFYKNVIIPRYELWSLINNNLFIMTLISNLSVISCEIGGFILYRSSKHTSDFFFIGHLSMYLSSCSCRPVISTNHYYFMAFISLAKKILSLILKFKVVPWVDFNWKLFEVIWYLVAIPGLTFQDRIFFLESWINHVLIQIGNDNLILLLHSI